MKITYISPEENAAAQLVGQGIESAHFTNGVYSYSSALVVPTVLAGFEYAVEQSPKDDASALVIAVNSDKSMKLIMDKKNATQAERDALENHLQRARKVAFPLMEQHLDREIVVIYYDEETPNALYDKMNAAGFGMKSLFKWGYGTNPQEGVIEGVECFDVVRGHPLPNDIKPVCTELTRKTGQAGYVDVVDLRGTYISSDNKILFMPKHPDLLSYAKARENAAPAPGASTPAP